MLTQWRPQVVVRIESLDGFIRQMQLVDGDIGRDWKAFFTGSQYGTQSTGTAELAKVNTSAGVFDQRQHLGHRHGLGRVGNAAQPHAGGYRSLVRTALIGQVLVLGADDDQKIVAGGIFQRTAQNQGIRDRGHGVADCPAACFLEKAHFAEILALQSPGQRAYRLYS